MNTINIIVSLGDSTNNGRAKLDFVPDLYQDMFFRNAFRSIFIFNTGTVDNEQLDFVTAKNHTQDADKTQFGFVMKLAGLLNGANKAPLCFVRQALGSTSLAPTAISGAPQSFDKATGTMYSSLLTNITTSHNQWVADGWAPNYLGVICLLGLNDSTVSQASTDFESNLTALINNLYADSAELTTDVPFLICKPNIDTSGIGSINPTYLNNVRTAIDNVNSAISNTKVVNLDGLRLIDATNIHHDWIAELTENSVADRIFAELF